MFLSLKIEFIFANIADPDAMPTYAAFYQGFHCFPKYPLAVQNYFILFYSHTLEATTTN